MECGCLSKASVMPKGMEVPCSRGHLTRGHLTPISGEGSAQAACSKCCLCFTTVSASYGLFHA